MSIESVVSCQSCEGVVQGFCIVITDDRIVYAGPIGQRPSVDGQLVILNPADFERLRKHVHSHRH